MDRHHARRLRLPVAGCTACGASVPSERVAVLADRGDLAFVEIRCPSCGSETLGLVLAARSGDGAALADAPAHPELGPADEPRLRGRPPVSVDDVVRMRRFLEGWEGDLRSLVDDAGAARGDRP